MDKQTADTTPPKALDTIIPETDVADSLPDEVDSGATTPDNGFTAEERTARALGACGDCGINGRSKDEPRYCSCEYGRECQVRHMRRIEERFGEAGVPTRLQGVSLDSLKDRAGDVVMHTEAVQAVRDLMTDDTTIDPEYGTEHDGLCILGTNGRGKSGLLVILARQVFLDGHVPLFIKYADLVRDGVQSGYGEYTSEGVELSEVRRQAAQRVHTLCLDDLGDPFAEHDKAETQDRRDILFRILSTRHERGITTHFTANYSSLGEIARQFDPRIADRIKEMCAIVQLDGPNLREMQ